MTYERDPDRLTRLWLEIGPDQAPDRAIDAVLHAIETTPQVRRSWRWPIRRERSVYRLPILAGLAAVFLVVVFGLAVLFPPARNTVGGPTAVPSRGPSTSDAASTSTAPTPIEINGRWMAGRKSFPGLAPAAGTSIAITDVSVSFSKSNDWFAPLLYAHATTAADHVIELSRTFSNGCKDGDIGRYRWSVSADGATLDLAVQSDVCAVRSAVLAGSWTRMTCKDFNDGCLGDIPAGTYASQYIYPRLPLGEPWTPIYAALTYTVPGGWANAEDWPSRFRLTPSADYATESSSGPIGNTWNSVVVLTRPAASRQDAACSTALEPGVGQTPNALVDWIVARPGITATAPADIQIDGHPGRWIDVSLKPGWKKSCPFVTDNTPTVPLVTEATGASDAYQQGPLGRERMRLIFLDIGGGATVLIMVDSSDPARFDSLVAASMPVIQSMHFQ